VPAPIGTVLTPIIYAGDTVPVIVDRLTGQVRPAKIFVAVMGASNFTYAEASWTQALADWIGAHTPCLRSDRRRAQIAGASPIRSGEGRRSGARRGRDPDRPGSDQGRVIPADGAFHNLLLSETDAERRGRPRQRNRSRPVICHPLPSKLSDDHLEPILALLEKR
jgi:hypothetical protein